ncbi:allantoinase alX [Aspergillus foveolatus]|uniref:allantoinase alX n=1 Tax=Aspergillus foveolatus TaxID=210207 RepID=UPI003CCCD818
MNGEIPSIAVFTSSRAVIGGRLTSATIVVSRTTGKVTAVFDSVIPASDFPDGTPYTDFSPYVLLPGLVDAHVHLNEPGRTEWEGFYTGTQAAAFGGVTTVIDMPLNAIPPTTTVENFKLKLKAAEGKCWVDVGFYGGIIPGNAGELKALVREGVRGFKGFLIDSGVDEFPAVSSEDVRKAMAELADEPTTLMFHAEMVPPKTPSELPEVMPEGAPEAYSTFLASRPSEYELCAVEEILSLSHLAPKLPLHIVHLSAMEAIPLLRKARAEGVPITAETCYHYLSLAAEEIRDGDTRHKCCPPIRSKSNQDALWAELDRHAEDGVIKTIVSDHSPCTPDLKLLPSHIPGNCSHGSSKLANTAPVVNEGSFLSAWGGISSVGLGLPILWTELSRRKGLTSSPDDTTTKQALQDIVHLCCANTAAQVGLHKSKGDLVPGYDADFCVFDDTAEWVVEPSTMLFRNKCSPYQGRTMRGMVRETWLRGEKIFNRDDGFTVKAPSGSLLLEKRV